MPDRTTGVLTFHRSVEYGSYWQARCLVEGLRARGLDAVLLDHYCPRAARAELRCALRPVPDAPKRDALPYARKLLRFGRAFAALPRSPGFLLDQPEGMKEYDLVVVGSDEVWSQRHPWYAGRPAFYGEGVKAGRLVSYAASFGSHSVWEGLPSPWPDHLLRFDAISVRDENSWWMVKHFAGLEPELALDPCLQFPVPLEGPWRGPQRPFIAVYGHSFLPEFATQVQRVARDRGLKLVSIGYRNDWADSQWLDAGPHDFAHGMARAAAVATNVFHGCVFALRNARPFVCEASMYRSIKLRDLMAAVGGERHLVGAATPAAAYDALLGEPLEPEISRRIDVLRRTSSAYLDRATETSPLERPQPRAGSAVQTLRAA